MKELYRAMTIKINEKDGIIRIENLPKHCPVNLKGSFFTGKISGDKHSKVLTLNLMTPSGTPEGFLK